MRICRQGRSITHLFFADNTLIFSKADKKEVEKLKQILKVYEESQEQVIIMEKPSVFFSKNAPQQPQERISSQLGNV